MLERFFQITSSGSSVRTEVLAGATTFFTLSYIIFVQPAILSNAGMDFGAVMTATCIASAAACLVMGLLANYPIALAPAMGHNFFFTFTVILTMGYSWQGALGAVFISGSLFLVLSLFGLREHIMHALPGSLRSGIVVGIGLLIALLGLEWCGIVVDHPALYVGLGDFKSPPVLLSFFGLAIMSIMLIYKVPGGLLFGMLCTGIAGLFMGLVEYRGIVSTPPSIAPTLFRFSIADVFLHKDFIAVLFIFFFLDLFDTIGTLIGVSERAGLMQDGKLPRARKALFADAFGTVVGACCGTSTITSYVESVTGVTAGGRTGLTSVIVALLFIVALFFAPLVKMIGGGYIIPGSEPPHTLYPVIGPALILVGSLMLQSIKDINFDDYTEVIPAFLTMMMMTMAFSITEGIAIGIISYTLLKLVTGNIRSVSPVLSLFAVLFILRYIFLT